MGDEKEGGRKVEESGQDTKVQGVRAIDKTMRKVSN